MLVTFQPVISSHGLLPLEFTVFIYLIFFYNSSGMRMGPISKSRP